MPRQTATRKSRKKGRAGARCWTRSVGEHGYTVRVYEAYPGSNLYRSVWIAGPSRARGKEDKKSLGHRDRPRAVREAHALIVHLQSLHEGVKQGEITLGVLQAKYLASQAHAAKAPRTRQEDEIKLKRVVHFIGTTRRAVALDGETVLTYVAARRTGDPRLLHVRAQKKPVEQDRPIVRDRTIEADLVALHTMLRWGCVTRNEAGETYLKDDPLKGVAFPRELNPLRPILTEDDYEDLLHAADRVHPLLRPGLIVSNGTGRRLSAWRQLRWCDVRFDLEEFGAIRWPEDTDKNRIAMFRPISRAVRDVLREIRPAWPEPDAPVFPSPRDPRKPASKRLLYTLLREAYASAGLVPSRGGMWHPVRRKWVTERKGYPLADIAAAGGWKDERSLKSYMQEDPETVRKVVLEPTHRLRRGQALPSTDTAA